MLSVGFVWRGVYHVRVEERDGGKCFVYLQDRQQKASGLTPNRLQKTKIGR